MPTAAVPVVNRALVTLLGDKPIADLAEDSTRAIVCATEYEPLVSELFEGHDWNFASLRVASLAPLLDGPLWDYAYAFQLPADCVRVRATSEDRAEGGDGSRWQVEGRTLVADVSTISLRYTARVPEGHWRAAFATAVAYALAARIALAITGKASVKELYEKLAPRQLALAKALDGQEGSPRRYITDALTRDRD